jgi:hypothetical protein
VGAAHGTAGSTLQGARDEGGGALGAVLLAAPILKRPIQQTRVAGASDGTSDPRPHTLLLTWLHPRSQTFEGHPEICRCE